MPYISTNKSTRLAIIADDLTGALDSAAPFAGRGLWVEVAVDPEAAAQVVASGADIVVINTASREIPKAEAQARVAAAVAALPDGVRLFKKVDSRLKGHVAAEISALSFHHALAAPAIPAFGRYVQKGDVVGFGVAAPISVADALGIEPGRVDIPDIQTDADLDACLAASSADLLIGARGLAEALARQMTAGATPRAATLAGPCGVFVIGSRDPITLAQVAHLCAAQDLHVIKAPNGAFVPEKRDAALTLVQATPGKVEMSGPDVGTNLARGLHPAMTQAGGTLLLTGGATAEAILHAMGIKRMRLLGECLPGLAVATAAGLVIVTKSGGFGHEDTLLRVAQLIENRGMA